MAAVDLTEPSKTFLDHIAPFIRFLKIFGFHSMTLYRKNPRDRYFAVKVTRIDIFWLIFSATVYVYFIYQNVKHRLVFSVSDSPVGNLAIFLLFFVALFQTAGCAIMNFLNRHRILKLFNQMLLVEKMGQDLGFYRNYKEFEDKILVQFTRSAFVMLVIWSLNAYTYWLYRTVESGTLELVLLFITYFWTYVGFYVFVINFSVIVMLGLSRYMHLSQMIE